MAQLREIFDSSKAPNRDSKVCYDVGLPASKVTTPDSDLYKEEPFGGYREEPDEDSEKPAEEAE